MEFLQSLCLILKTPSQFFGFLNISIYLQFQVWSVSEGRELMTLHGHKDAVLCCSCSWDNRYIVTSSVDTYVMVSQGTLVSFLQFLNKAAYLFVHQILSCMARVGVTDLPKMANWSQDLMFRVSTQMNQNGLGNGGLYTSITFQNT